MLHICVFLDYFDFSHIFGSVLSLIELKIKFMKFYTKFAVKQAKFLPLRCTGLLLRSKSVQQICLRFFKNLKKLHAQRDNMIFIRSMKINNLHVLTKKKQQVKSHIL